MFLAPVLVLLVFLFDYACFDFGAFLMQAVQRRQGASGYRAAVNALARSELSGSDNDTGNDNNLSLASAPAGFPLLALATRQRDVSKDELDVAALKELETVRAVSRLAPMLGLIATMVPMGPALKSLSNGNIQGISDNLIVAFSAVIFGLVIASMTFWVASYKKRWLAVELVDIAGAIDQRKEAAAMRSTNENCATVTQSSNTNAVSMQDLQASTTAERNRSLAQSDTAVV